VTPEFVAAVRAAHAEGWKATRDSSWAAAQSPNRLLRISWDDEGVTVWRRTCVNRAWSLPQRVAAVTVEQGIDVLVALDVLPGQVSSTYKLGFHEAIHARLVGAR
jgi:hypothetical protein